MTNHQLQLLPYPKKITFQEGCLILHAGDYISIEQDEKTEMFPIAKRLKNIVMDCCGKELEIIMNTHKNIVTAVAFKKTAGLQKEQYTIDIGDSGIIVCYSESCGAFCAVSTLKQILFYSKGKIPFLSIVDKPDIKVRGIMLDISRDRIFTLETLFGFVDIMADLKYNQLQLYVEGLNFAYPSFPNVWKGKAPMTGEDVIQLDNYCKERYIELVCNQSSFGHMSAWLERNEFENLAEKPDGYIGHVGLPMKSSTLNPLDKGSIELVEKIIDDVIPYFSSNLINLNCDETFEIGQGHSKEECEKHGKATVYLDFVMKIYEVAQARGKRMMMWADIAQEEPEIFKKMPKDIIALEWGYEANHDFDGRIKAFVDEGFEFYVCPGTACWCSYTGRTDNMKENLLNAAVAGKKYGAAGFLNTDWNDVSAFTYQPFTYLSHVYGAAVSWGVDENSDINNALTYLNDFIFKDSNSIIAKLLYDLGNYYQVGNRIMFNEALLTRILTEGIHSYKWLEGLDQMFFEDIKEYIKEIYAQKELMLLHCDDAELISKELDNMIQIILAAANAGIIKLKIKSGIQYDDIKEDVQKSIDDMTSIITTHITLFMKRNKAFGLDNCIANFVHFREALMGLK